MHHMLDHGLEQVAPKTGEARKTSLSWLAPPRKARAEKLARPCPPKNTMELPSSAPGEPFYGLGHSLESVTPEREPPWRRVRKKYSATCPPPAAFVNQTEEPQPEGRDRVAEEKTDHQRKKKTRGCGSDGSSKSPRAAVNVQRFLQKNVRARRHGRFGVPGQMRGPGKYSCGVARARISRSARGSRVLGVTSMPPSSPLSLSFQTPLPLAAVLQTWFWFRRGGSRWPNLSSAPPHGGWLSSLWAPPFSLAVAPRGVSESLKLEGKKNALISRAVLSNTGRRWHPAKAPGARSGLEAWVTCP